ncbi:MAG TPA: hypothetical protein VD789_06530 [Thermomicrobiales bacterium]|nr:hypothetical protein [Thermomicrobiales bacterium]
MAFVLRKMTKPGELVNSEGRSVPHAPGAVFSPQVPGQVPDRSTVPGEGELPVPVPETSPRRPLTEYGTAQRIMGVYEPKDGNEDDPTRFEQAPISYEEQRKAYPALRSPLRPRAGYALAEGMRQSTDQVPALNTPQEVPPGE